MPSEQNVPMTFDQFRAAAEAMGGVATMETSNVWRMDFAEWRFIVFPERREFRIERANTGRTIGTPADALRAARRLLDDPLPTLKAWVEREITKCKTGDIYTDAKRSTLSAVLAKLRELTGGA